MGLFDKKFCDVCGEKIGLLGNRKLDDGNLCKDCAAKLSPWFSERRHSTVAEIKQQLDYREQNKAAAAAFRPTVNFGDDMKLYIDQMAGTFAVTRYTDFAKYNPDIIPIASVTSVAADVDEDRDEIYTQDAEGKNVSYNPPRYKYSYDFKIRINVNHPYFSEIEFKLNNRQPEDRMTELYHRYEQQALDLQRYLVPNLAPTLGGAVQGGSFGTGGFAAYTRAMRSFSGDVPIDFQIYGASESMMATCTHIEEPEFALLCDSCFFEFIPAEIPEKDIDGTKTLNIDQLEVGKEYEIVITNLSGFCRCRIKDVVKVLGYEAESPKITFAYRKSQLLDLAGDKITESMMDETIRRTGEELGVNIIDYAVYPNRDDSPSHY
ncbi:MAG: GH3 auxin-responsive promoter family protein, partial [Clostridia bacterium]|nr:GH3 auxin-responsive promoter family protein [Clostridia bacterium]